MILLYRKFKHFSLQTPGHHLSHQPVHLVNHQAQVIIPPSVFLLFHFFHPHHHHKTPLLFPGHHIRTLPRFPASITLAHRNLFLIPADNVNS